MRCLHLHELYGVLFGSTPRSHVVFWFIQRVEKAETIRNNWSAVLQRSDLETSNAADLKCHVDQTIEQRCRCFGAFRDLGVFASNLPALYLEQRFWREHPTKRLFQRYKHLLCDRVDEGHHNFEGCSRRVYLQLQHAI